MEFSIIHLQHKYQTEEYHGFIIPRIKAKVDTEAKSKRAIKRKYEKYYSLWDIIKIDYCKLNEKGKGGKILKTTNWQYIVGRNNNPKK